MTIQEKIKEVREEKRLSQYDMADKLGISQSAYLQIEKGKTDLTVTRLFQIAEVLEISPYTLLGAHDFATDSQIQNVEWVRNVDQKISDLMEQISYLKKLVGFYEEKDKKLKETVRRGLELTFNELASKHELGKVVVKNLVNDKKVVYTQKEFGEHIESLSKVDHAKVDDYFDDSKYLIRNVYDDTESASIIKLAHKEDKFMNELFMFYRLGLIESEFLKKTLSEFFGQMYSR